MKQVSSLQNIPFITHGFYDATDSNTVQEPILMTQVHSPDSLFITKMPTDRPKVDALITTTPHLALTVYTADCAPILLADTTSRMIAAIHAGWKGAFQGVIEATVLNMIRHGACLDTICAGIGPHIQRNSFEMDAPVKNLFPKTEDNFFTPVGDKFLFDFDGYVIHRLKRAGITTIAGVGDDTYTDKRYFSFRRGDTVPRQYSTIMIQEAK